MERFSAPRRLRKVWVIGPVAVAVLLAALGALVVSPAAATQGFCGQTWGSLPKGLGHDDPGYPPTVVTGVRGGRHTCFDRLTFVLGGPVLGYRVEYVPQVTSDGSGAAIPLRGGAFLDIVLSAPSYDASGQPTYQPADRARVVDVRGWSTFRQVAFGGSFEARTTFGLGVRARLPFRVFTLAGPGTGSRVVVDVGHRW